MFYKIFRNIIAIIKLILFFLTILIVFAISPVTYLVSESWHRKLLRIFSVLSCLVLRVKVKGERLFSRVDGEPGALYVSNHCSYIDIIVLGVLMEVRFTPKSDLKSWPILGALTNLSLPVYIDRKPSKIVEQRARIKKVIASGDNIIIFPEGTTNNGRFIKPFKSSLFSVVESDGQGNDIADKQVSIKPIAIKYNKVDGKAISEDNVDMVAWHGDMEFVPHFWDILKARGIEVEVIRHQAVFLDGFESRKELAEYCQDIISKTVGEIK